MLWRVRSREGRGKATNGDEVASREQAFWLDGGLVGDADRDRRRQRRSGGARVVWERSSPDSIWQQCVIRGVTAFGVVPATRNLRSIKRAEVRMVNGVVSKKGGLMRRRQEAVEGSLSVLSLPSPETRDRLPSFVPSCWSTGDKRASLSISFNSLFSSPPTPIPNTLTAQGPKIQHQQT